MYLVTRPSITKVKLGSNGSFEYHHDGLGISSMGSIPSGMAESIIGSPEAYNLPLRHKPHIASIER
ncbi:hypothetical protein D3C85_1803550 [compost metagenome]